MSQPIAPPSPLSPFAYPTNPRNRPIALWLVWRLAWLLLSLPALGAGCGADWTWRNPLPQGNPLNSVVWSGTQFVAVGEGGTILTSPDATAWTPRSSNSKATLNAIAGNGSRMVAVGVQAILASQDGTSWTALPTQAVLNGVAWGGDRFVAVGYDQTTQSTVILTSPDGLDWTTRLQNTGNALADVTWDGGQFVAVGGTVLTSPDGITWTEQPTALHPTNNTSIFPYGVAWNGQQLAMVGMGYTTNGFDPYATDYFAAILTSPDAATWTQRTSGLPDWYIAIGTFGYDIPPSGYNPLYRVIANGGGFLAVGENGTILDSPDGVAWTQRVSGTQARLNGVARGGGRFVAVGDGGTLLSSPDGIAWSPRSTGPTYALNNVSWGARRFVALGDNGAILSSPDGTAWASRTPAPASHLYRSARGVHGFVAIGANGENSPQDVVLLASPNGLKWRQVFSDPSIGQATGIAWGGGKFVAVGSNSTTETAFVLIGRNGRRWRQYPLNGVGSVADIAWGRHRFVAVGGGGAILSSLDGRHWIAHSSGTTSALSAIAWGGTTFVAVGEGGIVLTSPDGTTWTRRDSGISNALFGVSRGHGGFVAVGEGGTILTSPDGTNWTGQLSGTVNRLVTAAWGHRQWVAAGQNGTLLTSQCP